MNSVRLERLLGDGGFGELPAGGEHVVMYAGSPQHLVVERDVRLRWK